MAKTRLSLRSSIANQTAVLLSIPLLITFAAALSFDGFLEDPGDDAYQLDLVSQATIEGLALSKAAQANVPVPNKIAWYNERRAAIKSNIALLQDGGRYRDRLVSGVPSAGKSALTSMLAAFTDVDAAVNALNAASPDTEIAAIAEVARTGHVFVRTLTELTPTLLTIISDQHHDTGRARSTVLLVFCISFVVSLVLLRRVLIVPIVNMNAQIMRAMQGDLRVVDSLSGSTEVAQLQRGLVNLTSWVRRSIEQLSTERAELAQLIAAMPVGVIVVDEGRITDCNPKASELLERSENKMSGARLTDVLDETDSLREMVITASQGRAFGPSRIIVTDGNTQNFLQATAVPYFDGAGRRGRFLIVIEDLTMERRLRDVSERTARELRAIMDSVPGFLIVCDLDARLEFVSRVPDPSALEGATVFDFTPPEKHDEIRACFRQVKEHGGSAGYESARDDGQFGITTYETTVGPVLKDAVTTGFVLYAHDVSERVKRDAEIRLLAAAVEDSADAISLVDPHLKITYVNVAFENLNGVTRDEVIGQSASMFRSSSTSASVIASIDNAMNTRAPLHVTLTNQRKDGTLYKADVTFAPVSGNDGVHLGFMVSSRDITEREREEKQMAHTRKMESIGALAAGIAHEINTPTQFVMDNTSFLERAFKMRSEVITSVRTILSSHGAGETTFDDQFASLTKQIKKSKIDYLDEQIPKAISQSLEGLHRIAEIVSAMKEFSHPSQGAVEEIQLASLVESTVTVARNEWKYVAEMHIEIPSDLPAFRGTRDELSQAILNLVVNAAHAISDVTNGGAKGMGHISLGAAHADDFIEIRVSDSGTGMPESVKARVFDPFFTTKEVGKGTGQGLAFVHAIIVDKHHGSIEVESEPGKGTTFILRLPVDPSTNVVGEDSRASLSC